MLYFSLQQQQQPFKLFQGCRDKKVFQLVRYPLQNQLQAEKKKIVVVAFLTPDPFFPEVRKEIANLRASSNPAKAIGGLNAIVGTLEGGNSSSKSTSSSQGFLISHHNFTVAALYYYY